MTQEIPDFYRYLFEGKPINYYRSVLRSSVKLFLSLNHFIYQTGKYYDEVYEAYIFVQNPILRKAEKGDRYRFITYQSAHVVPGDITMDKFYRRLIPEKCKEGTIIKIIIPKKCENCALINEIYGVITYHAREALIPPYAAFTFRGTGRLETNSLDFDGFKQVVVKLDKSKCNLQEDESFWMEKNLDLEK